MYFQLTRCPLCSMRLPQHATENFRVEGRAADKMPSHERRTCMDGFEVDIFKLVREGATSEQWKEWLRVPLEHAAADGNMDLFKRLMDAGADGSAGWRGCHGRPLLGAAAHGKDEKMVLSLLKAGAKQDVNVLFAVDDPDMEDGASALTSALHVAARQDAGAVSRALMVAGADPNLLDGENQTPLHVAAEEGHHVVVANLILKGANVDANGLEDEETPLHLAARGGQVLCISTLLLGGANMNSLDQTGRTPLHYAVERSQLKAAEELMAAGADLDVRNAFWDEDSALDCAVRFGEVEIVKSFIRHGGDVRARDFDGCTPLHRVRDNSDLVIPILLEAGADLETECTEYGRTPLLQAAQQDESIGAIRALLARGANVNASDRHDATGLHVACENSSVDVVELLLRWGGDETRTDDDGHKPVDMMGKWEADSEIDEDDSDVEMDYILAIEARKIDDEIIRHMLARAPADRSWRRRGWLVMCRSHPSRVQLAKGDDSGNGRSIKAAKGSVEGTGGMGDAAGDETMGLERLVERLVGLGVEDVFRLVVGFL